MRRTRSPVVRWPIPATWARQPLEARHPGIRTLFASLAVPADEVNLRASPV